MASSHCFSIQFLHLSSQFLVVYLIPVTGICLVFSNSCVSFSTPFQTRLWLFHLWNASEASLAPSSLLWIAFCVLPLVHFHQALMLHCMSWLMNCLMAFAVTLQHWAASAKCKVSYLTPPYPFFVMQSDCLSIFSVTLLLFCLSYNVYNIY